MRGPHIAYRILKEAKAISSDEILQAYLAMMLNPGAVYPPRHMVKAASIRRKGAAVAKYVLSKVNHGIDTAAGAKVYNTAKPYLKNPKVETQFNSARTFKERLDIVGGQVPASDKRRVLGELQKARNEQNLYRSAILAPVAAGTVGPYVVNSARERSERKAEAAHREQVLNYYRQRGIL